MQPLRLAVLAHPPHLPEGDRKQLASLLARCGLPIALTRPHEAELLLSLGADPPGGPLPAVTFSSNLTGDCRALLTELVTEPDRFLASHSAPLDGRSDRLRFDVDLAALLDMLTSPILDEYEERDEHGRPPLRTHLLYQQGVLDRPAGDQAARAFGGVLARLANRELPPAKAWTFCASFDIDSAGIAKPRTLARVLRTAPRAKAPALLAEAALALAHLRPDPQASLRELAEMLEGLDVPATFLTQTHRRHRLDCYALADEQRLLTELNSIGSLGYHEIGLHSSYATIASPAGFWEEQWTELRRLLGGEAITAVHRGHYLRTCGCFATIPQAREAFVDSSMGFGSLSGFRNGTCHPFAVAPGVIEQPPVAMDSGFLYHMQVTAEDAFDNIRHLMAQVRSVGGVFVLVMHPHHFHQVLTPGWRDLLQDLIAEARSNGATFQPLAAAARAHYKPCQLFESSLEHGPAS